MITPDLCCLRCSKLDIRSNASHAAVGLGKCEHIHLDGVFVSFGRRRDCEQFKAADDEVAQKLVEWWERKKGKGK